MDSLRQNLETAFNVTSRYMYNENSKQYIGVETSNGINTVRGRSSTDSAAPFSSIVGSVNVFYLCTPVSGQSYCLELVNTPTGLRDGINVTIGPYHERIGSAPDDASGAQTWTPAGNIDGVLLGHIHRTREWHLGFDSATNGLRLRQDSEGKEMWKFVTVSRCTSVLFRGTGNLRCVRLVLTALADE